jgi:hypothetical protein
VTGREEIWVPLVDEPIGSIVSRIQRENPDIDTAVATPRRVLAFRTFAYIRVGVVLGRLLFENDVPPYDGSESWIELLLHDPAHRAAVANEVRAVAEEIAAEILTGFPQVARATVTVRKPEVPMKGSLLDAAGVRITRSQADGSDRS